MSRTIATLVVAASLVMPTAAWAGRKDDAFNRIIIVVDTSGTMRQDDKLEMALGKATEVMPSIRRYREDELVVLTLNGDPRIVFDGHAVDLVSEDSETLPPAWDEVLGKLREADRRHTDITETMKLLDYVLGRFPSAEAQYVLLFSDMKHEPPRSRPSDFDIEADVPWSKLEPHYFHLLGVDEAFLQEWTDAVSRHGMEDRGTVNGAAKTVNWTIDPVERAEAEVVHDNPWEGRGEAVGRGAVAAGKWLLIALAVLVGLVALLGGAAYAARALRRQRRRRRRPARRGRRRARARARRGVPPRSRPNH